MERLKNMGLKKSFFFLSVWCILLSLVLVLLVFFICSTIKSGYPPGGIEIGSDGVIIPLEQPTTAQQRMITLLTYFQWLSCIILPVSGLGVAAVLFYRIAIVLFVAYKIVDWKTDREFEQEQAKRDTVEKRLAESLKGIC